jgi:hypothetical protein
MSKLRAAVATGVAAAALSIIPAGTAGAHVHGISPLECTPAVTEQGTPAGAIEGVDQAADAAELPEAGAIPRVKSELGAELTGGQDAPVPMCP